MPGTEDLIISIIDDDEDIRKSLTRSLTKRGYRVASYRSANDFLKSYDETKFGCLLLDYGMPDINGLELQQLLIKKDISIPIIFMTGHGGIPQSVQAMKAGAVDFLEKPFKQDVLIKAIHTAFDKVKDAQEDYEIIKALKLKLDLLTVREKEIAQLIVQNPADTSSKNIGRNLDISSRTVEHHKARILEKMDVSSAAELVEKSILANLF
jgi:two-component system response regulator FixJ